MIRDYIKPELVEGQNVMPNSPMLFLDEVEEFHRIIYPFLLIIFRHNIRNPTKVVDSEVE
jgi:hypothetical protein